MRSLAKEGGTPGAGLNSWGSLVAGGSGEDNDSYPKAFVNILVFDKNYNLLEIAYDGINGGHQEGISPDVDHDYMKAVYLAREECYVYLYISNENATLVDVYFDDVVMTHKRSRLIQGSEYYPYGMQTANSWTRESNVDNNFLANGGTELNTTTQVYDLYYRNYDPVLGRFGQVDPKGNQHSALNPYHFGVNNPVSFNDPLGDKEIDAFAVMDGPIVASGNGQEVYRDSDPYGGRTGARIMAESIERQTWAHVAMFLRDLLDGSNIFSDAWNKVGDNWDGGAGTFTVNNGEISFSDIYKYNIVDPKSISPTSEKEIIAQTISNPISLAPSVQIKFLPTVRPAPVRQGTIIITRHSETSQSTIGNFDTLGDGDANGFILEPPGPSTTVPNQNRRIPSGAYRVIPWHSEALGDVFLLYNDEVSQDRRIYFHIGNYPGDTAGCLLPGTTYGVDYVGFSAPAFQQLGDYIRNHVGGGGTRVYIFDPIPAQISN